MLHEFWVNFTGNLFKPLLLFFYMGFAVPLLKIPFEFPKQIYQGLTMYLLVAIGWHGGEELARLSSAELSQAGGFMLIGFATNFVIGIVAYFVLRTTTRLRKVDAAMVSGFYGSDSAGTFATAVGVLAAANIAYAAYMPVLLAVMEIPGCLVALYLVSRLRQQGMDSAGNMPGEAGYGAEEFRHTHATLEEIEESTSYNTQGHDAAENGRGATAVAVRRRAALPATGGGHSDGGHGDSSGHGRVIHNPHAGGVFSKKTLHEIFLNPGLFLLFGGILIGFLGQLQGAKVVAEDNNLFINLFHGALCLFLLEMGITACSRLRDLKTAGWPFMAFAIGMPPILATFGIVVAHVYSMALGVEFAVGTYVLFAVLCAAASYIAVPAVQRLAVPEASPTLPLAASLGLTFTFNVTIGIPIYIEIAKAMTHAWPVATAVAGL